MFFLQRFVLFNLYSELLFESLLILSDLYYALTFPFIRFVEDFELFHDSLALFFHFFVLFVQVEIFNCQLTILLLFVF